MKERGSSWRGEEAIGIEKFPSEGIEKVVIAPAARELLDPSVRHLATENFIAERVFITVPKDQAEEISYTPSEHGRTIFLERGRYPYSGMLGSVILGKGGWLSGRFYGDWPLPHKKIAWGLETKWDADGDLEVNEVLLNHHFFASLTLGYAVLNERYLKTFLEKRWGKSKLVNQVFKTLNRFERSKPVFSLRLGGTLYRLYDDEVGFLEGPKTRPRLGAGSRILSYMIKNNFPLMRDVCAMSGEKKQSIVAVLKKIADGEKVSMDGLETYLKFLYAIFARNIMALRGVWKDKRILYHVDGMSLAKPKDIDTSFMQYDFDMSYDYNKPEKRELNTQIEMYTYNSAALITNVLDSLKEAGLFTKEAKRFVQDDLIVDPIIGKISKLARGAQI
ncbi:MAG TPA: hypothetical protein VJ227_01070 [Patescibacteria group bacterium]|nr:hypothetical protein [Patescibacteria group bacterium]